MAENNRFKTAIFGGFRRKDVLECFDRFVTEKADEMQALNDQIAELREQLAAQEKERAAFVAEKETLIAERQQIAERLAICEKALIMQKEKIDSMSANNHLAESESKASRQLLKERDVKIAFLEDKNQKLILKMEAYERKSKKYDALSVEIGEMMLEAKQSAESIIRQGEERSAKLTAEANSEVDRLSADLNQFLQQLNHIKSTLHSVTDGMENKLQSIENSVNYTQANITAFRKGATKTVGQASADTPAKPLKALPRENPTASPRLADKAERRAVPEQDNTGRMGKTLNRLMELIGRD